jgi:simple sugar transport system permease protein/ribose transport system permease protein
VSNIEAKNNKILPKIRLSTLQNFFLDNITWFILLAMVVVASIIAPKFLTKLNLLNLLTHVSILGILVVAESLCLITGNLDLSIESTLGFSAVIAAWLMVGRQDISGWNVQPFIAIIVMLLVGAVIGLINGYIIVKIGLDPFIATLAMLIILRGLTLVITKGVALYNLPSSFNVLGSGNIIGIQISVIVWILIFAIAYFVMSKCRFGRVRYAIGGSKWAALASGIRVDRVLIATFVYSSLLAAFAGWILAGRLHSVVANLGEGMVFDAFAASVIGGVSLRGGRGTLIGALSGVLLIGLIGNILTLAHVSAFWIDASRGMLIMVAMIIDSLKQRIRRR